MTPRPELAGPRSLLELWHPTGAPARRLGLGGAAVDEVSGDRVDFVVVAPAGSELRMGWLDQAVRRAAALLGADGVLCVVTPRRWRAVAARLIRRSGLEPIGELLTVPAWPGSAHAVSLDAAALRDSALRHHGIHPAAAAAGAALVRGSAGRALVRAAAPGCALLAARSRACDPLRWLATLDGATGRCVAAATTGPRHDARVAVALRFAPGRRAPDLVAKVALDSGGRARVERERAALAALGESARRAGAAVPTELASRTGVLATTALAGRPASALLARDPARAATILTALCGWQRDWTTATAFAGNGGNDVPQRLLLAPAARVAAADGGIAMAAYADALRALAARLEGRPLVLAGAHNDLTMANVLVAGDRLGIVDWESGCAAGPPLADLWYALADGIARSSGLPHPQAVAALVQGRAPLHAGLTSAPARRARELGLTDDEALLSFHACWLHHAGNELDRGDGDGRFRAVVAAVAAQRLHWPLATQGERP